MTFDSVDVGVAGTFGELSRSPRGQKRLSSDLRRLSALGSPSDRLPDGELRLPVCTLSEPVCTLSEAEPRRDGTWWRPVPANGAMHVTSGAPG